LIAPNSSFKDDLIPLLIILIAVALSLCLLILSFIVSFRITVGQTYKTMKLVNTPFTINQREVNVIYGGVEAFERSLAYMLIKCFLLGAYVLF